MKQFWLPEEIALNGDLLTWKYLGKNEQDTYMKVLAGLTLLDTEQGNTGMPIVAEHVDGHQVMKILEYDFAWTAFSIIAIKFSTAFRWWPSTCSATIGIPVFPCSVSRSVSRMPIVAEHVDGHQRKAVLNFMAMMENAVHAKSYSNIFMTLAPTETINEVFEWVKQNKYLQKKAQMIVGLYKAIQKDDEISLFKAMVASVYLESFLFYSGFYYPLYFYGQGKLMQSGEIINLILRDEAIHGVYVGLLAQEIYNKQTEEKKAELREFAIDLLNQLYENED